MRVPVMQGALGPGINLTTVLRAVSLSRQLTSINIQNPQQQSIGEIQIKSGHMVRAQSQEQSGRDAFFEILGGNSSFYRVERIDGQVDIPDSLGNLTSLLDEAVATIAAQKKSAHLRVAKQAKTHPPGRPVARANASQALIAIAEPIQGLQALMLVGLHAQSGHLMQWQRNEAWDQKSTSSLVTQLLELLSQPTASIVSGNGPPEIIVEGSSCTLVLVPIGQDMIAAAGFDARIPTGFARFQISRLAKPLEKQIKLS